VPAANANLLEIEARLQQELATQLKQERERQQQEQQQEQQRRSAKRQRLIPPPPPPPSSSSSSSMVGGSLSEADLAILRDAGVDAQAQAAISILASVHRTAAAALLFKLAFID